MVRQFIVNHFQIQFDGSRQLSLNRHHLMKKEGAMKHGRMHRLKTLWTQHLVSADETYWQHFRQAAWIGLVLTGAGFAAFIHAVFPFLFTMTASRAAKRVDALMTERSHHAESPPS